MTEPPTVAVSALSSACCCALAALGKLNVEMIPFSVPEAGDSPVPAMPEERWCHHSSPPVPFSCLVQTPGLQQQLLGERQPLPNIPRLDLSNEGLASAPPSKDTAVLPHGNAQQNHLPAHTWPE